LQSSMPSNMPDPGSRGCSHDPPMPRGIIMDWFRLLILIPALFLLLLVSRADLPPADNPAFAAGAIRKGAFSRGVDLKRIQELKVHIKNQTGAVEIHPRRIALTVLGPDGEAEGADALRERISVYVDAAQASAGISVKPARIRLPDGYVLIKADPQLFLLEISPKGAKIP